MDETRPTPLGECPPGHDPANLSCALDNHIGEMRALLTRMAPTTDAEALQALRNAFPGTSLATRMAAMASHIP